MGRARMAFAAAYAGLFGLVLLTDWPLRVASHWPELLRNQEYAAPLIHLAGFAGLGWMAFRLAGPLPRWGVWIGLVVVAAGSELLQGLLPLRVADPVDLAWNLAGIAMAAALTPSPVGRPSWAAPDRAGVPSHS